MINRANIEFYQLYEDSDREGLSALLYVADLGQPGKMGAKLERAMKEARVFMKVLGKMAEWNGESVASLLIVLEALEKGYLAMPRFLSCVSWAEVEYLWRVYLGPKPGAYRIECFEVDNSGPKGFMDKVTRVVWQEEAGL